MSIFALAAPPLFAAARRCPFLAGKLLALAALPLLLGACAGLSPDAGLKPVQDSARQQLGKELAWARTAAEQDSLQGRVAELLRAELTADSAVQIALFNNAGLQATLYELGIAEAELVQASRLPNPHIAIGQSRRGDERETGRSVTFDLARLIALPLTRELEQRRLAAVQTDVSLRMLALAAQARKAFYGAVAAEQLARYQRDVQAAAEASAELAKRMALVGNFSHLQQAREQLFHAEASLALARSARAQQAAREHLIRLLGLSGSQLQFSLPQRLPDLPAQALAQPDIEQQVFAQRLDVQAARQQAEATAKNLGLSQATRFVNVLELGFSDNSSNQAARQSGYEIRFELPLFDWSGARVAKAEAIYMQSLQRAAQTAVEARSELREAYQGYRTAYDMARHYRDEVVPMAKRISDENLLRYNGMLISVFELLADSRAQIASVQASVEALREFWLAQADLDMALIGKPGATAN